jgi:hypothetical protein
MFSRLWRARRPPAVQIRCWQLFWELLRPSYLRAGDCAVREISGAVMRTFSAALALIVFSAPTFADGTIGKSISVRVGETRQLGVFGGHSKDCQQSILGQLQITQPPTLGDLSQHDNARYVAQNSMSHTCEGKTFYGTAVDYTAKSKGTDSVKFDAVFPNGTMHFAFKVTSR